VKDQTGLEQFKQIAADLDAEAVVEVPAIREIPERGG